jgi:Rrf2 family protein
MRISAKADYAVRATAELAAVEPGATLKAEQLAHSQRIPLKYLLNILGELKLAGFVLSHRGAGGGYALARLPDSITIADVIRAVEGPLATVQDIRPEDLHYGGAAAGLEEIWVAVRSSLRAVLEQVTLADLVAGTLPKSVSKLARQPEAWTSRGAGSGASAEASRRRRSPLSRNQSGPRPHATRSLRP